MQERNALRTIICDCIIRRDFDSGAFQKSVDEYPQKFDEGNTIHSRERILPIKHFLFSKEGFSKFQEYNKVSDEFRNFCKKSILKNQLKERFISSKISTLIKSNSSFKMNISCEDIFDVLHSVQKQFVFDHNPPKNVVRQKLKDLNPSGNVAKAIIENEVVDILEPHYKMIVISKRENQILNSKHLSNKGDYFDRLNAIKIIGNVHRYCYWKLEENCIDR